MGYLSPEPIISFLQSEHSLFVEKADIHTHLNRPNASPSPDIQDALRLCGDWRQIQLASQADLDQFVHYVEPITLFLKARQQDGGFRVAMQLPRHWGTRSLNERVSLCD